MNTTHADEEVAMSHVDIRGWCDFYDLYSNIAFSSGLESSPARFVEIGVAYGKSLAYLADQVKQANREGDVQLYGVDIWKDNHQYNLFSANMYACGVSHMIKPMRTHSHMAALQFHDQSLDFVFLDGDHRYKWIKWDIEVWLPKVKPGSILSGHDYAETCPGVIKAVNEILGEDNINVLGRSWVYRVKSN